MNPIDEMYPFIEGDLKELYDEFIESNSNILLLIGPPGTGKSSFIRGLLSHCNGSGLLTYDHNLLKDNVFSKFMSGNYNFFILEDADAYIKDRKLASESDIKEYSSLMTKLLNIGSGVISSKKKKLIITTNLESTDSIDPSLIRKGRCHQIINFRYLTKDEALILKEKLNIKNDLPELESYSLSEVFNGMDEIKERLISKTKKLGFK
jgi:ATP-dependent 26S proteasome regulatory subunit